MMEKVEAFYEKTLAKILNRSKVVVIAILALFVFSVFILTRLGGEFIPSLPEGDFAVDTRVLTGSNLKTSTDAVQKSSQILLKSSPK